MAWSDLPRIRQMMLGTSLPWTGCSERKSPLQPARLNQALSWSARWLSVWGISFVLCRRSGSFEGEKWTFWAAQSAHKLSTKMASEAPRMVTLSYTGEGKTTPTKEARRKAKPLGAVWEPATVRAKDQGRKPGRNAYRG